MYRSAKSQTKPKFIQPNMSDCPVGATNVFWNKQKKLLGIMISSNKYAKKQWSKPISLPLLFKPLDNQAQNYSKGNREELSKRSQKSN